MKKNHEIWSETVEKDNRFRKHHKIGNMKLTEEMNNEKAGG